MISKGKSNNQKLFPIKTGQMKIRKFLYLRKVNKISSTIWRSYFSFFQGEKAANNELFNPESIRDSMKKKWKRTSQMADFILLSFLTKEG